MDRLILLVESRIRGDVYVRFGGELPKTHRSNTAGRWMLSLLVNFARLIKVPTYITWGYNDDVCPPTTSYAVYNTLDCPKEALITPINEHWTSNDTEYGQLQWILKHLK